MVQLVSLDEQPVLANQEYSAAGLAGPLVPYAFSGQPILVNNQYLVTLAQAPVPPEPEPEVNRLGDPATKRKKPKKPKQPKPRKLQLEKGLEYYRAKYRVEQRQALERAKQAEIEQALEDNRQAQQQVEEDIADIEALVEHYQAAEQSNVAVIGDLSEILTDLQTSLDLAHKAKKVKMEEEAILQAVITYLF